MGDPLICPLADSYRSRETHDRKFIQVQTTLIVVSFAIMPSIGIWSMNRLKVTPSEVRTEVLQVQESLKELQKTVQEIRPEPDHLE